MFRWLWHTWLQAAAFVRTLDHKMDVGIYSKRESQGHEVVKVGSGRLAITMGIDCRGKTSSAVAKPPLSDEVAGISLGRLEVSSATIVSFLVSQ